MINVQALPNKFSIHLMLVFTSLLLIVVRVMNKMPSQQVTEK